MNSAGSPSALALSCHPEPSGNLHDTVPIIENPHHGLLALLHNTQLHQHDDDPLQFGDDGSSPAKKAQPHQARTLTCNTRTGATVAQEPEPVPKVSPTYRSQHVNHDPGQHTSDGQFGQEMGNSARMTNRPDKL